MKNYTDYLESHEIENFNELLKSISKHTLSCWVATRLNGCSASISCDGNISVPLIKLLDEVHKEIAKHKEIA